MMRSVAAVLLPFRGVLPLPPATTWCDSMTPREILIGCAVLGGLTSMCFLIAVGCWWIGAEGRRGRLILGLAFVGWLVWCAAVGLLFLVVTPGLPWWLLIAALFGLGALLLPPFSPRLAAIAERETRRRRIALYVALGMTGMFLLSIVPFALLTIAILSGGTVECYGP